MYHVYCNKNQQIEHVKKFKRYQILKDHDVFANAYDMLEIEPFLRLLPKLCTLQRAFRFGIIASFCMIWGQCLVYPSSVNPG